MTKSEFIAQLAGQVDSISLKEAAAVVNAFFDCITDALARGEKVELRGFGSFKIKDRDSRFGRNPKTGETVRVRAKRVPYFKPGKDLRTL